MKEKIASLVAEGIDEALRELMPVLDAKFSTADERMLERVNLAAEKIRAIEKGLPDGEAIREAVYSALKGQLGNLNLDVETVKARVDALRELKDGDPGRDGKDGLDGRDGKDGTQGKDGLDGRDGAAGKDARDGKDGLDGRDGRDATFRAAVAWEQGKEYGYGTVATHRNGVWYAERSTDSEPSQEASGWILLAEGLHDIETVWDHEQDIRNFKMYIQMASGETIIHEMRVPFTQYREVWSEDEEYTAQDMVTQGGSIWMSLRDDNTTKPGTDASVGFWKLAVKRGADGKDGRRGEKGPMGLQGDKGDAGKDGKNGKDAVDGIDGKDGKRGPKGSAGPEGKAGKDGTDGTDGRDGDHFVDAEIDMDLRQCNFIKDDGTYVSIPLVKMSQAMEKAMTWRGPYQLGANYKAGDLVRVGTGKVVICLKDTNVAPAPYADGVRNQEEWDVFVWIDSGSGSGGGSGGEPTPPVEMWILSEGLDIDPALGANIWEAVNNLPTPLAIPENQATIFGYNNDKFFYTANQRDHSVGQGGNYVTLEEDYYPLTQEGLTEIIQQRISVEDTGDLEFLDRFNNYQWPNFPTDGLHLLRWAAYYVLDEVTDDVYVWQGPKDVRVGLNGDYVALDDDLKWISKGNKGAEGGSQSPIEQPAHGFALMDCIRWDGTSWVHAMADDENTMALGIVTAVDGTDDFKYSSVGRFYIPGHGATADEWYFLSDTIPGGLSRIEPENSQPIIYVETADWISVFPYRPSAEQIQSVGEAPEDGQQYARQDGSWEVLTGGGGGVPEAPLDGNSYSRQDATWVPSKTFLRDLEDTAVDAPPAINDILTWDGANWINVPTESTDPIVEFDGLLIGSGAPTATAVYQQKYIDSDTGEIYEYVRGEPSRLNGDAIRTVSIPSWTCPRDDLFDVTFEVVVTFNAGFMGKLEGTTPNFSDFTIFGDAVTNSMYVEWGSGVFVDIDTSAAGLVEGEVAKIRVLAEADDVIRLFVNDVDLGTTTSAFGGGDMVVTGFYKGAQPTTTFVGQVFNLILKNVATGEGVSYPVDDGSGLAVKAFDLSGTAVPALDGVISPDADWTVPAADGWVLTAAKAVPEAPEDGSPYARQDSGWVPSKTFFRDLDDTSLDTPPAMNDMLTWDGANWINVPRSAVVMEGLRELLAEDPAALSQLLNNTP